MKLRGVLALLAAPLCPGQSPSEIPIFHADVNLVHVVFSVRGNRAALVASLSKEDFEVREEGQLQEIRYFQRETDLPLSLGLLVDVSGSVSRLIQVEISTAERFLNTVLAARDSAFLVGFAGFTELVSDFTGSSARLLTALGQLKPEAPQIRPLRERTRRMRGGTMLFDVVAMAARKLRPREGRKVIVILTDGEDDGSLLSLADAIEAAQMADVVIYGLHYAYTPPDFRGPLMRLEQSYGVLRRMCEETGGRAFRIDGRDRLDTVFRQIQEEMRNQYVISYLSSNPVQDGAFRRIEVRAKQGGLTVQSRKGYYAATAPAQ